MIKRHIEKVLAKDIPSIRLAFIPLLVKNVFEK